MAKVWQLLVLVAVIQLTTQYPHEAWDETETDLDLALAETKVDNIKSFYQGETRVFGLGTKKTPEQKAKEKAEKDRIKKEKADKDAKKKQDKLAQDAKKKQEKQEKDAKKKQDKLAQDAKKKQEKQVKDAQKKKEKEEKDAKKKQDKLEQDAIKKQKQAVKDEKKKKEKEEKKKLEDEKKKKKEQEKILKQAEKEKKKLEKEAKKKQDPNYEVKKQKEDKLKFNSLNKKNKTSSTSKFQNALDYLKVKANSSIVAKVKDKVSKFKNKTQSIVGKQDFKYDCKCEDNFCRCCVKLMVKLCFSTAYTRVKEQSVMTLKLSARMTIEVTLYTHIVQFKKKVPACFQLTSPIGRVCFKGEMAVSKKKENKKTDGNMIIKVLFDEYYLGVQMNLEWENGTLSDKGLEIIEHEPKDMKLIEEESSEDSNEKDSKPSKVPEKKVIKMLDKYNIKINSLEIPKNWKGQLPRIINGIGKAKQGECECDESKCNCCIEFGEFKGCLDIIYVPPTDGIDVTDDDDYLDQSSEEEDDDISKETEESDETNDPASDEDDDDDDDDEESRSLTPEESSQNFGAVLTIVGTLKKIDKDEEKELASVSYSTLNDVNDELECEGKQRFGNICLKIDTIYLEGSDAKGGCISFVLADYDFGFKKCVSINEDDELTIGEADE